jgi:putative ABC transport system permease protein
MLAIGDNVSQSIAALRAHKLRASLTVLGLTMGVATLITVMTLVQGANLYVEQKIARLGTDVFQIAKMPFTPGDFDLLVKAIRFKNITVEDMQAVAARCLTCQEVGAEVRDTVRARYGDRELMDTQLFGQTANMARIDTRTVVEGRFFTDFEERRSSSVCVIGHKLSSEFFAGVDPVGRRIRFADLECTVIGVFDEIGSVLGQEQDNFAVVPLTTWQKNRGSRRTITISVKAPGGDAIFERAQDEVRLILRSRRQITGTRQEDFFIGTKESYMSLWRKISTAFFAVFVMVSSMSAVVGGIVIMNVMLVSVTERTKEIGVRRALGATQRDIRHQFLTESVIQCLVGGVIGICGGFFVALLLHNFTSFPAAVQTWVVFLGLAISSILGLFFGIYPAVRAARLDPVMALRSE